MRYIRGFTSLMTAAYLNLPDVIVKLNGDVNEQGLHGWTALMKAAKVGSSECVRLLLSLGADVSIRKKNGWTALDVAVRNGHADIVLLLLAEGAPRGKARYGRLHGRVKAFLATPDMPGLQSLRSSEYKISMI